MTKICFLIPVFNEAENINVLIQWLENIVQSSSLYSDDKIEWSIHFCDNNSNDESTHKIIKLKSNIFSISWDFFGINYGYHYSTSFLLSTSQSDISILIPADMQIPEIAISKALHNTYENSKTTLLCRVNTQGKTSITSGLIGSIKKVFYRFLVKLEPGSIKGFFGMGVYTNKDLKPVLLQNKYDFKPFQIRLVIPILIRDPLIVKFLESKRRYGKTGFGLRGYIKEAFSILTKSSLITDNGLQYLLISVSLLALILSIGLIFSKLIFPSLILPGFTTIILVNLSTTCLNIFGMYILWKKIEDSGSVRSNIHPLIKK